jgi:hypothetical protein
MAEYEAKLDRENYEREQAFLKKVKEMEMYAKKFENEGAGKIAREEQIRFEQQLLREQERKNAADIEKERQKQETRRRQQQEALEENNRQLEMRRKQAEEERIRDLERKDQFKREEDDYYRLQLELAEKKRREQDSYRHLLDDQVDEMKKVDVNLTGITPVEKKLNQTTLKQINEDPMTMTKVLNRIRFTQK